MSCSTQAPKQERCPFCLKKLMALYHRNLAETDFVLLWYWCDNCHKKVYEQPKDVEHHDTSPV